MTPPMRPRCLTQEEEAPWRHFRGAKSAVIIFDRVSVSWQICKALPFPVVSWRVVFDGKHQFGTTARMIICFLGRFSHVSFCLCPCTHEVNITSCHQYVSVFQITAPSCFFNPSFSFAVFLHGPQPVRIRQFGELSAKFWDPGHMPDRRLLFGHWWGRQGARPGYGDYSPLLFFLV